MGFVKTIMPVLVMLLLFAAPHVLAHNAAGKPTQTASAHPFRLPDTVRPMPPTPAKAPAQHVGQPGESRPPPPPPLAPADPTTSYDEQLGETLPGDWISLAYNVSAVPQVDSDGFGPAYLLNGLTDTGYWYQVGLAYNWPYYNMNGYSQGFTAIFEVWDPNGNSIYPSTGGSEVLSLNGPVNPGDTVVLNLYIKNNQVVMLVLDYDTGAYASETYSAEGASMFVGNEYSPSNYNGYFTGLMTEQYHLSPYYGGEKFVPYTEHQTPMASAILWLDEFEIDSSGKVVSLLFSDYRNVYFNNYYDLQAFSEYGATEYANAYGFFTGEYSLSVSVQGPMTLTTDAGQDVGAQYSLTVMGGIPPYTVYVYLDGYQLEKQGTSSGSLVLPVDFGRLGVGDHQAYFVVADLTTFTNRSDTVSIQVNPDPTITLSSPKVADQHQTVKVNYTVSGGTPPYTVTFYLNGQLVGSPNTLELDQLGQNSVYAVLQDGAGYTVSSNTVSIQVNPDPTVTVYASKTTVDAGQTVTFTANVSGGTPPYLYTWYVDGEPKQSSPSFTLNATTSGQYGVFLLVVDAVGYVANSSVTTVQANPDPTYTLYSFAAKSTSFFLVDNSVVAAVNVSGGTPPYTYTWYLNGVAVAKTGSPTYSYQLAQMGPNTLRVEVTDGAGYTLTGQPVTVNYTYNYTNISVTAVVAAAIVGAALLLRRRP